jgi:hypothetical protein
VGKVYEFKPGGGGAVTPTGGGGDMEARIAKLEAHVEHIQSDIIEIKTDLRGVRDKQDKDFRLLFGAIIFVALGITAILAKAFGWLK